MNTKNMTIYECVSIMATKKTIEGKMDELTDHDSLRSIESEEREI